MAQKLVIGPNYFVDFANAQGAAGGPASYFVYAGNLDSTFLSIFNLLNIHTDEINNVQGPGSVLGLDLVRYDDVGLHAVPIVSGVIGIGSYLPVIQTAPNDNRIDVAAGVCLSDGVRQQQTTPVTLTATDLGAGPETNERFLYLDLAGIPRMSELAGQGIVDLYRWDFATPSEVLSNQNRIGPVFFDGDDYEQLRRRRGTEIYFEGFDSVEFAAAGDTIVRTVGSWIDDGFVNGQTIEVSGSIHNDGTHVLNAAVTATTLTMTGSTLVDEGPLTEVRISAGHIPTADFDQAHQRVEAIEDILAGLGLGYLLPNGTVGAPALAFQSDPDTGIYRIAANRLGLVTGGVLGIEVNASQQRVGALQGRFIAAATGETQSADATWQDVTLTEVEDVGAWFTSGVNAVVPSADYAGSYSVKAWARFVTGNSGGRGVRILVEGVVVAEDFGHRTPLGQPTTCSTCADVTLANGDEIQVEVFQETGGSLNYDYRFSLRKED